MNGTKTLIRLHRQHLDIKRVYRADLETKRIALEHRARALRLELENEKQAAAESPAASRSFPGYAERMIESMRTLAAEMIEIDKETSLLNDEIAEAFQTLKRYELFQNARIKEIEDGNARRDRAELDEIGAVQRHRRQLF